MCKHSSLLKSAIIDRGHLRALQNLIFGPVSPPDLPLIEQALRALITVEDLRADPLRYHFVSPEDGGSPIGDHVLDYEFIEDTRLLSVKSALDIDESRSIYALAQSLLSKVIDAHSDELSTAALDDIDPVLFMDHKWMIANPIEDHDPREAEWFVYQEVLGTLTDRKSVV